MKFSADYRALALDALRGRWKTAVLAGLIASLLGANIVSSSDRVISNMSQNANGDTPGFAGLFSTGSGGVLAVLVICILAWAVFTVIVGGAVRLGYARFNLNLADGRDAALSDLASQKHRLWDGFWCSVALGICWKSGVAAEVIGLPDGSIGDALYRAKITLSTGELFAWTFVIILLSAGFEKLFLALLDKVVARVLGEDVAKND